MQSIIVALISGLCVAIPNVLTTVSANKKNQALIDYKINELTEHVIKHNGLIDRMYKVETRLTVLEDNLKK